MPKFVTPHMQMFWRYLQRHVSNYGSLYNDPQIPPDGLQVAKGKGRMVEEGGKQTGL